MKRPVVVDIQFHRHGPASKPTGSGRYRAETDPRCRPKPARSGAYFMPSFCLIAATTASLEVALMSSSIPSCS